MQTYSEFIKRFQKLARIKISYAIEVVFLASDLELIIEHKAYQKFQKTQNRYTYHPKDKNIPVKGHYHIYPNNSKKEIYAVNLDGSAHHKSNRGFQVPKKEATELRKLGVQIPDNRILEHKEVFINENLESYSSIFIIINE
ncbi:hypothetical protein KZP23_04605 [Echinicola marina]|uniref:Uncharacterized protein n=1 Tax=Echinicola rosea TaxID=1807691 RepID=A0ABQ1V6S1_9BACT|nr:MULTISPECIES: hypothetical protein [Echinicola]UCS94314.1 hypothetical protein KZP23_04605 [Echinicola marina]GGF38423.1 hypothetical protein GCM10011339_28810 [Echinicola rosea]